MDYAHPVSHLQELMAKQRKDLPVYNFEATASNCAQNKFVCKLHVDGIEVLGTGANKQTAKYEAAKQAVQQIYNSRNLNGESLCTPPNHDALSATLSYNPVGKLNEITSQQKMSYPSYTERGMDGRNQFIIICQIGNRVTSGMAPTKKNAKQAAAHHMLKLLNDDKSKLIGDLPKEAENFPDDEHVINKFLSMSLKNEIKHETNGIKLKQHDFSPVNTVKSEEYTKSVQDMLSELQDMNINYDTEVMQKDPYVLVLKLHNDGGTVMEMGESYDDAFIKVLEATLKSVKTKQS